MRIDNRVKKRYFKWMCQLITGCKWSSVGYEELLLKLLDYEFIHIHPKDNNRRVGGIDFRREFALKNRIPPNEAEAMIGNEPCSVLEMMVALAYRCEEEIMTLPTGPNRTPIWFWDMIFSLGLMDMTNDAYDEQYVDDILHAFVNLQYQPNGMGGLYTTHRDVDQREIEIWYQMHGYLNEFHLNYNR